MFPTLTTACAALSPTQLAEKYVVPADVHTQIALYPFAQEYQWQSLHTIYQTHHCQGAIALATPRYWQLDPIVHTITTSVSVPDMVIAPPNFDTLLPLSEAFVIDVVIVAASDVLELLGRYQKLTTPPKVTIVIHTELESLTIMRPTSTRTTLIHELHIVPGLPLLTSTYGTDTTPELHFELNNTIAAYNDGNVTMVLPLLDASLQITQPLPITPVANSSQFTI